MEEKENKNIDGSMFPFPDAKRCVKAWDLLVDILQEKHSRDLLLPLAFFIPLADLQALAAKHGTQGARAYLAITDFESGIETMKLLLVPADIDKDFPNDKPPADDQSYPVYDFTMPCPPTCPKDSPMSSDKN